MSRNEVASHVASMRPAQLAPMHGEVTEIQTSGSIGAPLSIASNRLVHAAANAAMTRMAHWWGADTARSLARLRVYKSDAPQYPAGRDGKGWSYANPQAAYSRSRSPDAGGTAARMAGAHEGTLSCDRAVKRDGVGICGDSLNRLATSRSNSSLPLERPSSRGRGRWLRTNSAHAWRQSIRARRSEPSRPSVRPRPVITSVAENVLVEILRDDGMAAGPGEVGQVVVTGFYNYAMPFIRYAIGDVAIAAEGSCPCGRSLPVIAQVLGRTRCAFVFADGTRIWPRGSDALAIRRFVPHREFQMVQVDQRRIEFRYVPDATGQSPDMAGLDAYMQAKVSSLGRGRAGAAANDPARSGRKARNRSCRLSPIDRAIVRSSESFARAVEWRTELAELL